MTSQLTRLEALAHGQVPAADAPCCPFHATGGHPDDRHGLDPANIVYRPALCSGSGKRARATSSGLIVCPCGFEWPAVVAGGEDTMPTHNEGLLTAHAERVQLLTQEPRP